MWFCPRCGHDASAAGTCPRDGEVLARVSQHDLIGRELGEYKVLASLGGGSFGSVYRAVHLRSGMLAAIKLLHRPIEDAESKRVLIEARAAAMLDHPNVVKVYDLAVSSDRRPYIVMQLLDGKPLSQLLATRMEVPTAIAIINDVLAALAIAHPRGVIHRDLKPDNIFVTKGRAMIVDFGLAKLIADPQSPSLTATGEALGTPHYMAPEQVRGELADGRADLYAVGCVLFEMLAGRPPFEGSATFAIFDAHLHQPPPSIMALRPDVPAAVAAAIAHALAKDPGARVASAGTMQRELTTARVTKRRWPLVLAVSLVLVAVIAVGAVVAVLDSASGGGSGSSGPALVKKSKLQIPPLLPDEPALDPNMESTIEMIARNIEQGHYKRSDVVALRCSMDELYARPPIGLPAKMRAYARRVVKLLQDAHPDIDPAVDCKTAPVKAPPATARRIAAPEPQVDELPLDENIELAIATLHEQLDLGRLSWQAAQAMHCDFDRQDRDAIAAQGSVPRLTRSMHRRLGILIEAYHPGVTTARCR